MRHKTSGIDPTGVVWRYMGDGVEVHGNIEIEKEVSKEDKETVKRGLLLFETLSFLVVVDTL